MEQSSILEAQIICMRLLLFMMCLWSLFSCGSVDKTDADKTIFRYNESAGIHSFDPAFAKDQARIWFCNQVYNSLVQLDSTLQVQPSIAKNWSLGRWFAIPVYAPRRRLFSPLCRAVWLQRV